MSYAGKTVLVTGAGGFIGSHLAERLVAEGARVRAFVHYNALGTWGWLDRSPVKDDMEVIAGDICDRDSVAAAVAGCDTVFHLAALIAIPYSYIAPFSYVRTNVEGTLNVLQAARAHGTARLVHTSTSEVYGTALRAPIDEDHPLQGQSPYSASKIGADKMAESFYQSFGLPVVTVRPFNTYGPRQSARAVIPTIISQGLARQNIRLGNLTPTRDFNFVADTVAGFLAAGAAQGVEGDTINLGTGREISIGDLVTLIGKLVGHPFDIQIEEERQRRSGSEVERLLADASRAKARLGWAPSVTLEQGLQQTVDWIRENPGWFRTDRYTR